MENKNVNDHPIIRGWMELMEMLYSVEGFDSIELQIHYTQQKKLSVTLVKDTEVNSFSECPVSGAVYDPGFFFLKEYLKKEAKR